tara:strand:+ start:99635 stop:100651 length:1017 start_codon:yes stop_codon:yes gene_type:complete
MQHKKIKLLTPCLLFTLCLLIGSTAHLMAQTGKARTSKDSLQVGESFTLSINVQLDKKYDKVVFPDTSAFPPIIGFNSSQRYKVTDFADSATYQLQFFTNKDITLPPFQLALVEGTDTSYIYTNPVPLYFKTVLPEADADFKPIKPIFPFDTFPWPLAIVIAALLIAAAVIYHVLKKRKENIAPVKVVPVREFENPIENLESALMYLKQEYDLATTGDYKFFYSSVSDAIRTYYEDLYNIPALESTTREVMRYLDAFGVDHEMITYTRHVLANADMVKFAKYTPSLDRAWSTYQFAVDFLDRARLVDASRITRKRSEFENMVEEDQSVTDETVQEGEV